MMTCWQSHSDERPDFSQLVLQIRTILHKHALDPFARFVKPEFEEYYVPVLTGRVYPNFFIANNSQPPSAPR